MNLEECLKRGIKPCKNDCEGCFKLCMNYEPIDVVLLPLLQITLDAVKNQPNQDIFYLPKKEEY